MSIDGIRTCIKFAYPPNYLHLCGPEKQNDLKWYTVNETADIGTEEILASFTTLYPYLKFIASENNLKDPFDKKVVDAYWLGNDLLNHVKINKFAQYFAYGLKLRKKLPPKELNKFMAKLPKGAIPHHSFHVMNIYTRTGNLSDPQTVVSMDACLINFGRVESLTPCQITIRTRPLTLASDKLSFGKPVMRIIENIYNNKSGQIKTGDIVSYHWGKLCKKLSAVELKNLIYYTNLSLNLADKFYR